MNDYFEARGIDSAFYDEAKLPHYYKEIIESLPHKARILDFGCGFGQNLYAIKNGNFAWRHTPMGGGEQGV